LWTNGASSPTPKMESGGIAAAVVKGEIYVFEGESPDKTFDSNEKYNPQTNSWTEEPPMPIGRHGLMAVAVGNISM
jgi:N-acetylneuraminic acid mutarotase